MPEPKPLRRGKAFHREVQAHWEAQGALRSGTAKREQRTPEVSAPPGKRIRRGRMDVYVTDLDDDQGEFVFIVEIKATDWDRIKPKNIRRNLSSHRRQLWRYAEDPHIEQGVDVGLGIVYPRKPKRRGLVREIESYMEEYGIVVTWFDDEV